MVKLKKRFKEAIEALRQMWFPNEWSELEEMRQSHNLDMQTLRWEQQKYMLEREKQRKKWDDLSKSLKTT